MNHIGPNTHASGGETLDKIESLAYGTFDWLRPDKPVLGYTDDDIVAPNLHALLEDPTTVVRTVANDGEFVGFSFAIPLNKWDPSRQEEPGTRTSYAYLAVVEPKHRHDPDNKWGGQLMDRLCSALIERGYTHMECDVRLGVNDDFASKFGEVYKNAVEVTYDHARYEELGPERFFRINLAKLTQ